MTSPAPTTLPLPRTDPAAAADGRRLAALARLAFVLMVAVVVMSAYVRLQAAGYGCTPWPQCARAVVVDAEAPALVTAARLVHRVSAALALALVLSMAFVAWPRRAWLQREFKLVMALLAVLLGLAALGVATRGTVHALVAAGNLGGGFVMLALAARIALPRPERPALQRPARFAFVAWVLAVLAGLPLATATPAPLAEALHLVAAFAAATAVLIVARRTWRLGAPAEALAAAALLATAVAAGAAASVAPSLAAALMHNLASALLLALLATRV